MDELGDICFFPVDVMKSQVGFIRDTLADELPRAY